MLTNPKTPKAWAIQLAKLWGPHFPVCVRQIALEYTAMRFPAEPITKIVTHSMPSFEGALVQRSALGRWYILLSEGIETSGRINFTTAHEFGHYILHRSAASKFECRQEDFLDYHGSASQKREAEANEFASYLLMPLDDFRQQIGSAPMSLGALGECARRYDVSFTAAALKWLQFTTRAAVLIVARDGFVLWSTSSSLARMKGSRSCFIGIRTFAPDEVAARTAT